MGRCRASATRVPGGPGGIGACWDPAVGEGHRDEHWSRQSNIGLYSGTSRFSKPSYSPHLAQRGRAAPPPPTHTHLAQRCLDEAGGFVRQTGRVLGLVIQDVLVRCKARRLLKRRIADHQLVGQHAHCPHINLCSKHKGPSGSGPVQSLQKRDMEPAYQSSVGELSPLLVLV